MAFHTEIYSMCRFNIPNISERSDMDSSAFSSDSHTGIGFYVVFGDISVSDKLLSRCKSHVVHPSVSHFDNKSVYMLNTGHPSSENGPEII